MAEPRSLVDTSVQLRQHQSEVGNRLDELRLKGRVWTCRIIDLEVVHALPARDVAEAVRRRRLLPEAPITPGVMDRALQIMEEMAPLGTHQAAKPADCVIAACAERAGLALLHYDRDFDLIAKVTGQDTVWVAPAGSLDN